jgi:Glycosyl hydrolase catalytic core
MRRPSPTRTAPLIAAIASLAAAASLAAPPAQAARFYGVVYDRDVASAPATTQDAQFQKMHATGIKTVRRVFSWADAQPAADQPPSFAETDAFVARAARNDIEILPIVMYAPPWARTDPGNFASPPANPSDYTSYVLQLENRYGPNGSFWSERPELPKKPLRTWQIWNEPQLRYQWASKDWEAGYGQLLRAAHGALKKADPGCTIVLAGATNFAWDALESLYDKGGVKGQFDVAALHPYTGSAGRVVKAAQLFRAVLKKHGDAKLPVWITELAWPASKGRVKPPSGLKALPTTDQGMATRLTRAYKLLSRSRVVQRAYWYTWASTYKKGDGIFGFTGLERYDPATGRFTPTPALRAFRRLAR